MLTRTSVVEATNKGLCHEILFDRLRVGGVLSYSDHLQLATPTRCGRMQARKYMSFTPEYKLVSSSEKDSCVARQLENTNENTRVFFVREC